MSDAVHPFYQAKVAADRLEQERLARAFALAASDDLVRRLRDAGEQHPLDAPMDLFGEAADEIEHLRALLRPLTPLKVPD